MPEQFFYLSFTGIYFVIWIILFLLRKDLRKEMLALGVVFGIAGVISQLTHVVDWWQPPTITGTRIGIEDFLIGFFMGGVVGVLYEEFFKKHFRSVRKRKPTFFNWFFHWSLLGLFAVSFLASFYIFGLHSFYAALVALCLFTFYMLVMRRDLIVDSLVSGVLTVIVGTVVYLLLFLLFPNYIVQFWYLPDVWFSKMLLGIPLAEYIWYFFAGAFIGPLYEYLDRRKFKEV